MIIAIEDIAIESIMADKIVLRFAENEDDLLEIEELSKNVHFDLGIHNRRLHFQYTPKTHLMFLDKLTKTVIGYGTGNFIRPDIFLRAQLYIKKEYRTQHTAFELFPGTEKIMGVPDNANTFYSCNGIALKALIRPFTGFVISEKMLPYEGSVDHSVLHRYAPPTDVTVRLLRDAQDLELLLAYDKTVHCIADRERFMRSWCTNDGINATTAIAISSTGQCVGFASLRRAVNVIEPAYGESDAIGLALLSAVLLSLPEKDVAQITFPGSQRCVLAFCIGLGWTSCMTEHRIYSKVNIDLPWKKVFAVQEFFLV